ncbi:MAG: endonuclease/exonuclease/phosphatase family protein [Spirochaetaceae bacterium]|nr:MAG: endonuclease/exonuclease/phosphatase family protein [Spirochaetaceae bacterium]
MKGIRFCVFVLVGLSLGAVFVAAENLRVVTINVWAGLDYKGSLKMGEYQDAETRALRTQNLVEQLKILDPDVIAVNEANKLPRYARMLAGEMGFDQIYHVGLGGLRIGPLGLPLNLREGDVILARKTLQLKGGARKQLSGGPVGNFFTFHFADATQVIGGRILVAGRVLYVFNTHWHASPFPTQDYFRRLGERRDAGLIDDKGYEELEAEAVEGQQWRLGEARKTIAFINKVAGGYPVILMGDFNAASDAEEIDLLRAAGFRDAFAEAGDPPGYTWDGVENGNIQLQKRVFPKDFWLEPKRERIDYIFYRGPGFEVVSCQVVLDQPIGGLYPSDHFGVMADFEVHLR